MCGVSMTIRKHQDQIQSCCYGQTQASLNVTVLHRHALLAIDGEESSEHDPQTVTEHLYVISPDLRHDHHSIKGCRNNVGIVYAATARFICSDLARIQTTQGKELFSLPEHQHLNILEALNGF